MHDYALDFGTTGYVSSNQVRLENNESPLPAFIGCLDVYWGEAQTYILAHNKYLNMFAPLYISYSKGFFVFLISSY